MMHWRTRIYGLISRHRGLAWIVLIALCLRLTVVTWGIGLRLHEGFYHPDESKVWSSTFSFPRNFLSNPNLLYGTALQYSIALVLMPFRLLWNATFQAPSETGQIQLVIIFSRIISCCLGAGCVGMVYKLGRLLDGERTGRVAAALLCVSPYHCLNSALTTLDVAMSFFATSLVVHIFQAAQDGKWRHFVWAGLAMGYLLGGKISGSLFLALPVVLTWGFYQQWRIGRSTRVANLHESRPTPLKWCQGLFLTVGIAGSILLVSMPHIFLHPREYLRFMAAQQHLWVDRVDHSVVGMVRAWCTALWTAMSPVSVFLALPAIILCSLRNSESARPLHRGLLLVLLSHVLFWKGYVPPRFIIVLAPVLCLYAAFVVATLMNSKSLWLRRAGIVILLIAVIEGGVMCISGIVDRHRDTRTACAAFLAQELALNPGENETLDRADEHSKRSLDNEQRNKSIDRIAFLQRTEKDPQQHAWRYPRLSENQLQRVGIRESPDLILTSSSVTDMLEKALKSRNLPANYVWPREHLSFWPQYLAPDPEELRFVDELFRGTSDYELMRTWSPRSFWVPEFGSPVLKLYRRRSVRDQAAVR